MRLTPDHLRAAPQFTNAMMQREIDLRGLSISALDETALALLGNQFDVINLTSNILTSLEYFPLRSSGLSSSLSARAAMDRVVTLIAHRNQLHRVSVASCVLALPNVEHFLADRNQFTTVRDICFLRHWKKLQVVSLELNPVMESNPEQFDVAKIRAFLVFMCPKLKLINYERVIHADRALAASNKKDFQSLLAQWESTGVGAIAAEGGRKLRKRGREGRAAAEAAAMAAATAAPQTRESPPPVTEDNEEDNATAPPQAVPATEGTTSMEVESTEMNLQTRLDQIEQRILSDDVTAEEIVALEHEMNEITAEMDRRKRRKK